MPNNKLQPYDLWCLDSYQKNDVILFESRKYFYALGFELVEIRLNKFSVKCPFG